MPCFTIDLDTALKPFRAPCLANLGEILIVLITEQCAAFLDVLPVIGDTVCCTADARTVRTRHPSACAVIATCLSAYSLDVVRPACLILDSLVGT